jgi:hypothetical protein
MSTAHGPCISAFGLGWQSCGVVCIFIIIPTQTAVDKPGSTPARLPLIRATAPGPVRNGTAQRISQSQNIESATRVARINQGHWFRATDGCHI